MLLMGFPAFLLENMSKNGEASQRDWLQLGTPVGGFTRDLNRSIYSRLQRINS